MDTAIIASIIVALISAVASVAGSVISAKGTRTDIMRKLELQQAIQQERADASQKSVNEKLDALDKRIEAQATYGTRIALLESKVERLEEHER